MSILTLFLIGCTVTILEQPQTGMTFYSDLWADRLENGKETKRKSYEYQYIGTLEGDTIYLINTI